MKTCYSNFWFTMSCGKVFFVLQLALLASQHVLGVRDLESDIIVADTQMNKTYNNAESLQVNIGNFNGVLFSEIVPYVNDIETRMYALGIDPVLIEELDLKYDIYMTEIRGILRTALSEIGYAYLFPTSKTSYDLRFNLSAPVLTEDMTILQTNNNRYKDDFDYYIKEVDRRITELFILNWELIRGTTGPDREAIDADREYIYIATTSYRDQLKDHMVTLDLDAVQGISDVNIVIDQL